MLILLALVEDLVHELSLATTAWSPIVRVALSVRSLHSLAIAVVIAANTLARCHD